MSNYRRATTPGRLLLFYSCYEPTKVGVQ